MGKKRVFEIAKELGYQNRDLIEKLQKLGFEVKSHSSTVDEEDVRRAIRKADEERRAKTQESRVSRGVIRRRPIEEMGGAQSAAGTGGVAVRSETRSEARGEGRSDVRSTTGGSTSGVGSGSAANAPAMASTGATVVRRRAADANASQIPLEGKRRPETEQKAAGPHGAAAEMLAHDDAPVESQTEDLYAEQQTEDLVPSEEAPDAVEESEQDAEPVEVEARGKTTTEEEAIFEPTPVAEAGAATTVQAKDDVVATPTAKAEGAPNADETRETRETEGKKERREARMARPDRKREEAFDEDDEKPELDIEDLGISVSDFSVESFDRPMEAKATRVAPPPPSTTVATQKKEEEPQTKIVRTIDPSVLRARLSASKRPEPPKEWGKSPEEVAASPLTELVVRTDASGKRKELVDVRKEAARGKAGKAGQRRREEMSAKDLLEHRRGQVYYPTPGRKRIKSKRGVKRPDTMPIGTRRPIEVGDSITVGDLAHQMSRKVTEVIGWMMKNGIMAAINQPIDYEVANRVATQFGWEVESIAFDEEAHLTGGGDDEEVDPDAVLRAPVVTVMGHVDHGKTSLLDRIRQTNVAGGEAGGITQRIAGYQVKTSKGMITFLDTPGHAAFTAMRARGANVTDIVVLVVAADDGIMPQTLEAIELSRQAGVPIIVALNKIDKAEANPDRVLQQLASMNLLVEEWGGEVLCRRISAKTGDGVDDLLELIALQAEVMELRANPNEPAMGAVVESELNRGRGPVATVLIEEGTLRVGDIVICGEAIGKVRAMIGDGGRKITEAGPSTPVQILGLDSAPFPGDELRVAQSLEAAKELSEHRREKRRSTELAGTARVSLQDLFARLKAGEQKELKIIVKADLQGSVEALKEALAALSTPKVKVSVIHGGVGAVVESDVEYAKASEAIIVGFAVRPDTKALKAARALEIDIRTYSVIYEAVDEVKLAMRGLLSPVSKERYLGRAEVRQTFTVPKVGTVAGCAVVDGMLTRSSQIRVLRDSKPIYQGKLSSLKRFKDDVREVKEGFECGMGIEKFNDLKVGDIIEAFEIVLTEALLDEPVAKSAEARP